MKLFKNEVGRPSNETLKKRKRFYIIIAVLVVSLLGGGSLILVNTFSNGEILGIGKNAITAKIVIKDYITTSVPVSNGYMTNHAGSYLVRFTHNLKKRNGTLEKLYYRVTTYKKKSLEQVDPSVSTGKCKSISSVVDEYLDISFSTKEVYATIKLYSDKKCQNRALDTYNTKHYLYDNTKPKITKACQKAGYVYITASDDYKIKNIAWVPNGTSCSKVVNSAKTAINAKSINNRWVNQKLTITKTVKACVWDLNGNVQDKKVDRTC